MTVSRARRAPGPLAWLPWVVANTASGALGGAAIDALGLVGVILFGIIGGIAQWLVLRRDLPVTFRWAAATAVGNVLAWAVIPIYINFGTLLFILVGLTGLALRAAGVRISPDQPPGSFAILYAVLASLGGTVSGAIVGQSQALVLQRQIRPATGWVRASAAGGAAAAGIAGLDLSARVISRTFPTLPSLPSGTEGWPIYANGIGSGAAFGLAYGVITGIALVRVLRQRAPEE